MVIAADKYVYLPAIGLLLPLAWLLGRWWDANRFGQRAILAKAGLLVMFAAVLTMEAIAVRGVLPAWKDSETLYRHMIAGSPVSPWPCNGLADTLAEQGRSDEAVRWYNQALKLFPAYPQANCNLASELITRGDLTGAIEHATRALSEQPRSAKAAYNLGTALLLQGRAGEAIAPLRQALELKWCSADAYNNLGAALFQQGHPTEAVEQFRRALAVDPNHANARANLSAALGELGGSAAETRPGSDS